MIKASDLWLNYRHLLLLLLFIPLQLWFSYCEATVKPLYMMFSPIDESIPFVKEFVVPYLLWYLFVASSVLYLGFTSKADFYKLIILLSSGMAIACTIFLVFPNGQNLRPEINETDVFSRMINCIYQMDTPTDVTPSLHVFDSIAVYISLIKCTSLKSKHILKAVLSIFMLSICASTVFIKQHSILDVLYGTILALALSGIIYGIAWVKSFKFFHTPRLNA